MTPDIVIIATALADVLARENVLLDALDLHGATTLLAGKQGALDDFARALAGMTSPSVQEALRVKPAIERLRAVSAENRRLLERGMAVQSRLVGLIAAALPKAMDTAPRYGARGGMARPVTMRPVAFSASA